MLELVPSVEPAVVFRSLAAASVPVFADVCLVVIEEDDDLNYLIELPATDGAGSESAARSMLATGGPSITRGAVRTPILAPAAVGERGYRGTVLHWWQDQRRPSVVEVGAAQLFVQLAVSAITQERLAERVREQERTKEHLLVALQSNREIGAAIGILMATEQLSQDQAFGELRTVSQNLHRKLFEVASEVVFTGVLSRPEHGSRRRGIRTSDVGPTI